MFGSMESMERSMKSVRLAWIRKNSSAGSRVSDSWSVGKGRVGLGGVTLA